MYLVVNIYYKIIISAYFSTDMASSGEQAPPTHSNDMVLTEIAMETAVDSTSKNRASVQLGKKTVHCNDMLYIVHCNDMLYIVHVHVLYNGHVLYSQTCLFRIHWDPMKLSLLQRCPHFTVLFMYIYIALGPQLPVLIIEVSLF